MRVGADATVVTYGMMVHEAAAAVDTVAAETGASVALIDLRSLKPWDADAVLASVRATG